MTEVLTSLDGGPPQAGGAVASTGRAVVTAQEHGDADGVHNGKGAGTAYHSYNIGHGTLYIYQDGSYRFDIDDTHGVVNGMGSGQSIVKTVTLVVNDGDTDSASDTFTITINGVNDAPDLTVTGQQTLVINDGVSADQVQNTGFTVAATDPEDHGLTYSVDDSDRFEIVEGVLRLKASQTFTQAEATAGFVNVVVTVTDDGTGNLTDSQTVRIAITDINQGPENGPGNAPAIANVSPGGDKVSYNIPVNYIIDPDGTPVTYSMAASHSVAGVNMAWVAFNPATGQVTITPPDTIKAGTVTLRITGSSGNPAQTHTREITFDVNQAPLELIKIGSENLAAGSPLSIIDYDDYFSDANGRDDFVVTGRITGPNGYEEALTFNADGQVQENLPAVAGAYTVTLTATPNDGSRAQSVQIPVNAASIKPVFSSGGDGIDLNEDAAINNVLVYQANAAPVAGSSGNIEYSLGAGAPDYLAIDARTGRVTLNRQIDLDAGAGGQAAM